MLEVECVGVRCGGMWGCAAARCAYGRLLARLRSIALVAVDWARGRTIECAGSGSEDGRGVLASDMLTVDCLSRRSIGHVEGVQRQACSRSTPPQHMVDWAQGASDGRLGGSRLACRRAGAAAEGAGDGRGPHEIRVVLDCGRR